MESTYAGYIFETTLIHTELTLRLFFMHAVAVIKAKMDIKRMIRELFWNWVDSSAKRTKFVTIRSNSAPANLESWRVKNEHASTFDSECSDTLPRMQSSLGGRSEIRYANGHDAIFKNTRLRRSLSDSRIG